MGETTSKEEDKTFRRFLLEGPTHSGKTSLFYRLKEGKMLERDYYHTYGIDSDDVEFEGEKVQVWDMGYRTKMRRLFRLYYNMSEAMIYVLDSTDMEKMDEGIKELDIEILQLEELTNKVVMVLANKQDLEGALGPEEIEARVKKTCKKYFGATFFVMPCSVATGEGVMEAFARFNELVRLKKIDKNLKKKERTVPVGLIPHAWETPDEEPENKEIKTESEDVKKDEDQRESCCMNNKTKKAWHKLKDPFKLIKSILTH